MFLSCFHFFSNYCFVLLLLLFILKWLFVCLFFLLIFLFSLNQSSVLFPFFLYHFFCFTLLSSVSKAASRFYSTLLPGRFFVIVGGSFCTSLKRRQKCRLHEKKKGLILQPGWEALVHVCLHKRMCVCVCVSWHVSFLFPFFFFLFHFLSHKSLILTETRLLHQQYSSASNTLFFFLILLINTCSFFFFLMCALDVNRQIASPYKRLFLFLCI